MFSSSKKVVHYERSNKSGKDRDRSDHSRRDSGVGSSNSSHRASLGTNDSMFTYHHMEEEQRQNLRSVQEALDAAYERIDKLESKRDKLDQALKDKNSENRQLKRERGELMSRIAELSDDLKMEKRLNESLTRANSMAQAQRAHRSSNSGAGSSDGMREEERVSAGRQNKNNNNNSHSREDRRTSWREMPVPLYQERPPVAPNPPPSTTPNPFTPLSQLRTSTVSYAASPYGASNYVSVPAGDLYPNDGRYHPYPL